MSNEPSAPDGSLGFVSVMCSERSAAMFWQGGRVSEILSACPKPGGGVHSWLLAAAHQCREAGLTKAEVEGPLTDRIPRSATTFVILTALARTKCGERWLNPQSHLACAVFLRSRTDVPPASHVELVTERACPAPRSHPPSTLIRFRTCPRQTKCGSRLPAHRTTPSCLSSVAVIRTTQ